MEQHAHQLPEFLHFLQEIDLLRGFVFGLVHTIIPLIGFYSGWSINRFLKFASNGYIAGIFGVVVAHVIADFIASVLDPNLRSAAFGIVLGGLIPLLFIPILDKYIVKSKHHIVVGDHDDIKKDLKDDHQH
jgi:H+/Cl- antiporter ClcA